MRDACSELIDAVAHVGFLNESEACSSGQPHHDVQILEDIVKEGPESDRVLSIMAYAYKDADRCCRWWRHGALLTPISGSLSAVPAAYLSECLLEQVGGHPVGLHSSCSSTSRGRGDAEGIVWGVCQVCRSPASLDVMETPKPPLLSGSVCLWFDQYWRRWQVAVDWAGNFPARGSRLNSGNAHTPLVDFQCGRLHQAASHCPAAHQAEP